MEAILSAGHIPAGMELFAAGDQSQWAVIKGWIEESDVYMLILGGRYGSIEPESGKSYTQLEYEYALEISKPLFAVVITKEKLDDKVKEEGTAAIEQENPVSLQKFRGLVGSKMVRFWGDMKDIKLAVLETLNQYEKRENLIGWIPGDQGVNGAELAEEIARLAKENAVFRERVAQYEATSKDLINGMPMLEFIHLLEAEKIANKYVNVGMTDGKAVKNAAGSDDVNLFHALMGISEKINGVSNIVEMDYIIGKLSLFGIIQKPSVNKQHVLPVTGG